MSEKSPLAFYRLFCYYRILNLSQNRLPKTENNKTEKISNFKIDLGNENAKRSSTNITNSFKIISTVLKTNMSVFESTNRVVGNEFQAYFYHISL
jgi:hypothetical protein